MAMLAGPTAVREHGNVRRIPITDSDAPTTTTSPLDTNNLGFLLAKASSRWNALLADRFRRAGYAEVRPAYGSILLPLFARDGLRMGDLAREARLSKQSMTTMIRLMERDGLVERRRDPVDARAARIVLTERAQSFAPVAAVIVREMTAEVAELLGEDGLAALGSALQAMMNLGHDDRLVTGPGTLVEEP